MLGGVVHIGWLQATVLGLLQGLTEFLPVSSTAHMAVASRLIYGEDVGAAFSAVVQLGPIAAIILYFRNDLVHYIRGIVRTGWISRVPAEDTDARLGWYTLLATIPLVVFGILLEKHVDSTFRKPTVMAGALILLALILLAAEAVAKKNKTLEDTSLTDSQVIGWAQVLALIPGASRSGVTITAGLLRGLDRESAARFSFLLSIPAITAAGLYKLVKVSHVTHLGGDMGPYLFSALVAGVFAYVVIRWFLGFMKHHTTGPFIIWRIALGLLLLGLVATNKITNDAPKQSEAPAAGRLAQTAP